jgi:YVTN family beta-propeller protein
MLRKCCVILVIVLIGCASQVRTPETSRVPPPGQRVVEAEVSQIVLYARFDGQNPPPVLWEIRKISLNRPDGSQIDIPGSAVTINLSRLAMGQQLLTVSETQEGTYTGATIFTRAVYYEATEEAYPIDAKVHTVNHEISVIAGNAKTLTLMIGLPKDPPVTPGVRVTPRLFVEDENPRPTGKLIYVANENSSNISVIDKGLKRVVYNVFVGTKPYALGADHRRNRLYIGDRRDGVIYEMDMISQHLIRATQIEFVDEPVEIEPIPIKDSFIVVNHGTDTIYLMDSFTSQIIETVEVGDGPVDAVYSTYFDLAFVLNSFFGTLTVIDMSSDPVVVDTTLQVELDPVGMEIDDNMNWLFITNSGSTDLSVVKIENLGLEKAITVGIGAGAIAFDPFGRDIYIGNKRTREIQCVDAYTGVVSYSVRLPSEPGDLLFDDDEKRLYVAIPDRNAVLVINPMRRKIEHWIETGFGPSSIAQRL